MLVVERVYRYFYVYEGSDIISNIREYIVIKISTVELKLYAYVGLIVPACYPTSQGWF